MNTINMHATINSVIMENSNEILQKKRKVEISYYPTISYIWIYNIKNLITLILVLELFITKIGKYISVNKCLD